MAGAVPSRAALVLLLLVAVQLADAARQPQDGVLAVEKKKHKHPYTAPTGMFIQVCCDTASVNRGRRPLAPCLLTPLHILLQQERASKQLPGAGQHFSFGALKPWEDVLQYLDAKKSE